MKDPKKGEESCKEENEYKISKIIAHFTNHMLKLVIKHFFLRQHQTKIHHHKTVLKDVNKKQYDEVISDMNV